MKRIFLTTLFIATVSLFSEESRLYQFSSNKKDTSYLSLEAGTASGISLITNRMQVSFLYSIFLFENFSIEGFSISTDLFLFDYNFTEQFKVKAGFGGGVIFRSQIGEFYSNALLRAPVNLELRNFYLSAVPMIGLTMFEAESDFVLNVSVNIGYKFDLYRETVVEEEKK